MQPASPLRYPGGKSSLAGLLREIRRLNSLGHTAIAEPFAGGAGASLSLLFLEETHQIMINDYDPSIHDFWWSLINRPREFRDMLLKTKVNMREWQRQRRILRAKKAVSRLHRGFAAFYLNRCNRSGIIVNGGPIGGTKQTGPWKIDARFNKPSLEARCKRVAEYKDRISVSRLDGIRFIQKLNPHETFFFMDPPYFVKGGMLYMNSLTDEYHKSLAESLQTMKDAAWVLTYDDCHQIRSLYKDWAIIRPFTLRYSAAKEKSGREILITPKWMQLPTTQLSLAISW